MRKELMWLLIGFAFLIGMFSMVNADVKTAPMDNVVQLMSGDTGRVIGSGFIVNTDTLVTAAHVAGLPQSELLIGYADGSTERVSLDDVVFSSQYDLAKAKIKKRIGRRLSITYSGNRIGTQVYTIGFPANYKVKWASVGILSSNTASIAFWKGARFVDFPAIGGCSGSPVLNNADVVVGVLVGGHDCITIIVGETALREFIHG